MAGIGLGNGLALRRAVVSTAASAGTEYHLVTDDGTHIIADDGTHLVTDATTIVLGTDDGKYLVTDSGVWIII